MPAYEAIASVARRAETMLNFMMIDYWSCVFREMIWERRGVSTDWRMGLGMGRRMTGLYTILPPPSPPRRNRWQCDWVLGGVSSGHFQTLSANGDHGDRPDHVEVRGGVLYSKLLYVVPLGGVLRDT